MSDIQVKVPSSTMLMGEYSVLFGGRALACALDKYISLSLTPRADNRLVIDSNLGQYQADLSQPKDNSKFSFILAAVQQFQPDIKQGFCLYIRSDFSHKVGLGSSAAVTVATVAALFTWLNKSEPSNAQLLKLSLAVVHQVQDGRGSGTDLAASIYGGIIAFSTSNLEVQSLLGQPPVALFYTGYKTPTPEVLKRVEIQAEKNSELQARLYKEMNKLSLAAEQAVQKSAWSELGILMCHYQILLEDLGVSDKVIAEIIQQLNKHETILGCKISGSGLGDCVIALGDSQNISMNYEKISVAIAPKGVSIEHG